MGRDRMRPHAACLRHCHAYCPAHPPACPYAAPSLLRACPNFSCLTLPCTTCTNHTPPPVPNRSPLCSALTRFFGERDSWNELSKRCMQVRRRWGWRLRALRACLGPQWWNKARATLTSGLQCNNPGGIQGCKACSRGRARLRQGRMLMQHPQRAAARPASSSLPDRLVLEQPCP